MEGYLSFNTCRVGLLGPGPVECLYMGWGSMDPVDAKLHMPCMLLESIGLYAYSPNFKRHGYQVEINVSDQIRI